MISEGRELAYCEHCGAFIQDFQDSCGRCSRPRGKPSRPVESPPIDPLLTWRLEESPRYSANNGRRLKDSDVALFLSFFLPGLGQVYDGRKQRGGLVLSIFLILMAANLITFYYRSTIGIELTILMLAIICVFWLGQVIDTVRVTTDTNWAISRMPEHEGGAEQGRLIDK